MQAQDEGRRRPRLPQAHPANGQATLRLCALAGVVLGSVWTRRPAGSEARGKPRRAARARADGRAPRRLWLSPSACGPRPIVTVLELHIRCSQARPHDPAPAPALAGEPPSITAAGGPASRCERALGACCTCQHRSTQGGGPATGCGGRGAQRVRARCCSRCSGAQSESAAPTPPPRLSPGLSPPRAAMASAAMLRLMADLRDVKNTPPEVGLHQLANQLARTHAKHVHAQQPPVARSSRRPPTAACSPAAAGAWNALAVCLIAYL